jgi:hypothetical protein
MDFTVILLFHLQLQLNFTIFWFIAEESEGVHVQLVQI